MFRPYTKNLTLSSSKHKIWPFRPILWPIGILDVTGFFLLTDWCLLVAFSCLSLVGLCEFLPVALSELLTCIEAARPLVTLWHIGGTRVQCWLWSCSWRCLSVHRFNTLDDHDFQTMEVLWKILEDNCPTSWKTIWKLCKILEDNRKILQHLGRWLYNILEDHLKIVQHLGRQSGGFVLSGNVGIWWRSAEEDWEEEPQRKLKSILV